MKSISQPVFAVVTLIVIAVLAGTKNVDMSDMTSNMLVAIFAAALFGYLIFVYSEKPADEREQSISLMAGKLSYLVGALVLSSGIVVQALDHNLDIWLPIALGSMVLAKLAALVIHNR